MVSDYGECVETMEMSTDSRANNFKGLGVGTWQKDNENAVRSKRIGFDWNKSRQLGQLRPASGRKFSPDSFVG